MRMYVCLVGVSCQTLRIFTDRNNRLSRSSDSVASFGGNRMTANSSTMVLTILVRRNQEQHDESKTVPILDLCGYLQSLEAGRGLLPVERLIEINSEEQCVVEAFFSFFSCRFGGSHRTEAQCREC